MGTGFIFSAASHTQPYTHLANKHRNTAFYKVPHSVGIFIQIPTSKSLIRAIKESVVVLLDDHVREGFPLFRCRIYSSRIMSTSVQQEH